MLKANIEYTTAYFRSIDQLLYINNTIMHYHRAIRDYGITKMRCSQLLKTMNAHTAPLRQSQSPHLLPMVHPFLLFSANFCFKIHPPHISSHIGLRLFSFSVFQ